MCTGQAAGSRAEIWQGLRHGSSPPKSALPCWEAQPTWPLHLTCLFMCLSRYPWLCLTARVCCPSFCVSFCISAVGLSLPSSPSLNTHPAIPFSLLSLHLVQNSIPGSPTGLPSSVSLESASVPVSTFQILDRDNHVGSG